MIDRNRVEPRNLTPTAMWEMDRAKLAAWAASRSLLEHLSPTEVGALTKKALIAEIQSAILRMEVYEDRRAFATDTVARPTEELI